MNDELSWEDIDENSLSLFDDYIHEHFAAPSSSLGEVVLCRDDETFAEFRDWATVSRRPLAYDTENTSLFQYEQGFKMKLLQWGDEHKAYVFVHGDDWAKRSMDFVMNETDVRLLAHNVTYDALVLDLFGYVDALELMERSHDTRILAHMVDPRGKAEGGVGHSLSDVARHYVDPTAPDSEIALKQLFKSLGWGIKSGEGYKKIPATHPTLIQYGGVDTILCARIYRPLMEALERKTMTRLISYEHRLEALCAAQERRGVLVDIDYAEWLYGDFNRKQSEFLEQCAKYNITSPDAPLQVVRALQEAGAVLTATTDGGQFSVDKSVLEPLMEVDGPIGEVASAVTNARHVGKWRESYVGNTLSRLDSEGRIHPKVNSLLARTARMSVTDPPLQQIPSGIAEIRNMYLAEPGCRMASIDFEGVELRVLAALSRDSTMLEAFEKGWDLHQMTAEAANVPRSIGKMTNFLQVYGGGPKTLAKQAGVSIELAKTVIDGFRATYPGSVGYGQRLAQPIKSGSRNYVITYSGRHLPVDEDRAYSALNYVVQSTARDVLGKAMIAVWQAGLWDYSVLPIHDEILFSFPEDSAEELCREAGVLMEMDLEGVAITTEPDLGQKSWGSLYEENAHKIIALTDADRLCYSR